MSQAPLTRNQQKRKFVYRLSGKRKCKQCDGVGIMQYAFLNLDAKYETCPKCKGTGIEEQS